MAKNAPLDRKWAFGGMVALICATNFASARLTGFPFLYCWTPLMVSELYVACGTVVLYMACAYTAFAMLRGRIYPALGGALFIIAIIELPRLADAAFRLGGSCG